jgi:hypothetical protein
MLFSQKAQSYMQQVEKLTCIRYETNVPRGGMDLLSIQIFRPIYMNIVNSRYIFVLGFKAENKKNSTNLFPMIYSM